MEESIKSLKEQINHLPISSEERERLLKDIKGIEKRHLVMDFKYKRTLKDKSIAINLLKTTIDDLQEQKNYIVETNKALSKQKEVIEKNHIDLQHQKQIVEEQSEALEANYRELERSYRELEQFSYIASHDLKSPLRSIASYAQLLKRRYHGKLDADADDFIHFIVDGAKRMNQVIRDLLEYARLGDKDNTFVATDINEIVKAAILNLEHEIRANNVSISIGKLPTIKVHELSILQLFQNLLGNAIKFRGKKSPSISINCEQKGEEWLFVVKDNGLGIEESYQNKIFQPFQRLHLDRPGSGMGLAICRKVVRLHGGDIWLESKIGEGTTFYFTISEGNIRQLIQKYKQEQRNSL